VSDDEAAALAATPIPTDGWRSRRYVAGCVAFVLVLGFIAAAYLWKGLSEEYAFYMLIADLCFLLMVLGLLSVKDLLEVAKLKYLGPRVATGGP
jgi:hypothetical protein